MSAHPRVSIITATYNRSNVLRYTIASVLNQTLPDWELLVIGDACTDDTAEVVQQYGDDRIRFINLEQNVGEQSGPNNEGFHHARGEYIAYLNHDDLWTSRHLADAIEALDAGNVDLVFSSGISIRVDGEHVALGVTPEGEYQPYVFVPASAWVLRRQLIDQIGGWSYFRECHLIPSQDWILRAWRAGKRLRQLPQFSLLAIQSGHRPNVYRNRDYQENEWHLRQIERDEAAHMAQLVTAIALRQQRDAVRLSVFTPLKSLCRSVLYRLLLALNQSPLELKHRLKYRRRGGMIDELRNSRGLFKLE